ncbi:MAG: translocation/assembly module TamB domain-containing protein [Acidobacteriia bacterium]|nr:translocation/assembly module TamB domain-containing protein [Terriglobia bacterium]
MTETGAKSRWRRVRRYLLWALVGVLLLFGGLAWYATTDSFQAMVRRRLVTELERITGGRVELGGFHTIPFRFRVDVRDLTIHGLEQPTDVPYAHVDRLVAQVKIISVLGAEFGFSQVVLERPVIHIIVYPDGRTNQPQPQVARTSAKNPVEQLFSMSINRLEVRHGELLWNDQKIPLDFTANDISADMTYSLLHRHYTCNLLLGKVDTTLQNYRPVAWTAEAHFVLGQDNVEIQSLKATSGRSHLQVSGRVKNFRDPKFEGTYDLSVDLTELAAVTHRREMRHGVFTGNGRGTWSMQDFSSQGKVLINDLDWRDESFSLANASLSAQFSVDPHRLTLTQIQSHLLGGSVSGDADITNWLSTPPAKAAKGKPPAEQQKGTVRLRIKDVSIASAAAALSTRSLPLERMNLAGATSGTVAAQWKGAPRNVEAEVALDVVPPLRIARGQIPLTARARATYRGAPGELQVAEFSAATRATQVQASGTLSSTAALKLSMTTTDVGEWQPILAALGAAERIPLALHGHASFNGAATGKLSDAIIAGNLQVQDFDSVLPATTRVPERQVHWDSLVTDLQVSQHSFAARNGRLRHGEAAIHFDLSASLQHGRFTGSSPFTSRVNVRNADAAELLALAGYDYPLTGTLDLHLQASGTWAEPHGEGRVLLTKATIYQEPVERFYSDLRFTGSEAELNNIQLTYHEARVSGGATYDSSTHAFHFNLTGSDFDLLRIPPLQASRVKVEGRMDFTAVGSGTLEEPVINATAHLRDLTLDHERAGDFTIDAVTQGADLRLTGHSQFEHAELSIDGNIHLRGDWPSSVNLHFNHLDVDPLLRTYLQGRVTGHSAVAGVLQLQGPLRMPRELNIAGNLSDFYADVENIKVHNDGPVRFSVSSQLLKLEQFRLVGEGTDLSATGSIQLSGERQLDFRAQGSVNLQLIESLNPDFTSSGLVTVDVTVSGTANRPVMLGRLQVSKGSLAYSDLPSALSDINGSLIFNQDRLQIESLTAHVGGGQVKFGGYVTTYNRQINFDLTLQGQDVRLRYPPGVSSTTTADLHWVGSASASTLSGDMTVTKLGITPGFDFGAYLERAAQTNSLPQTNPLLNRIRLDVHIVTTPELQMQTAVVRLSGDADLRLRGSAAKPVLLGRADVLEGEVYINGAKYRLERGDISFTNPVTTTPVLDLQAATRVRDYDITLNLNGQLDKLNVTYRSEPPLPTADIIALLALGRTQEESALQQGGQSAFTQEASSAIISEALNATVSSRVQRLFGVSRIKIDPQGLSTETSPVRGPQVTIEQQVANNLTLTYSTNVSQASQQIIQVEYNITRNISIVGIRDQNGVVSFDVRIRRRHK